MIVRLFLVLAGLLALGVAALAEDATKPNARDRTLITDCVGKAARQGTSADDCMYLVAARARASPAATARSACAAACSAKR